MPKSPGRDSSRLPPRFLRCETHHHTILPDAPSLKLSATTYRTVRLVIPSEKFPGSTRRLRPAIFLQVYPVLRFIVVAAAATGTTGHDNLRWSSNLQTCQLSCIAFFAPRTSVRKTFAVGVAQSDQAWLREGQMVQRCNE